MPIVGRVQLVRPPAEVVSIYPIGASRDKLKPLASTAAGFCAPEVAPALLKLHQGVTAAGGDFRVTDMYRSYDTQAEAHQRYLNWVKAGKPKPGSAGWDGKTMKSDYVAEPGFSNHNAGRAVDLDIGSLKFPGIPADKILDKLWELAKPLGWMPIIKAPTEGVTESWHFDFFGEWSATRARLESSGASNVYGMVAMCACLDAGLGGHYGQDEAKALQAQLHRIGQNPGAVDGDIGAKTESALVAAGFDAKERDYTKLFSRPTAA